MYSSTLLFMNMGTPEILMILFVVLLLFGGKKLPELARGLGKGIREFKDASDGVKREIHNNINSVTNDVDLGNPVPKPDSYANSDNSDTTIPDTDNPKTAQ